MNRIVKYLGFGVVKRFLARVRRILASYTVYQMFGKLKDRMRRFMLRVYYEYLGVAALKRFILKVDFVLSRYTVHQIWLKSKIKLYRKFSLYNGAEFDDINIDVDSEAENQVENTVSKEPKESKEVEKGAWPVSPDLSFDDNSYDLVMAIPFTGRYDILEYVINEFFAANDEGAKLGVCLAGSSKEDEIFAKKMKKVYKHIAYQGCPNYPLGKKAQLSLDLTRTVECDVVLMNGSDDVISADYVKSCISYIELEGVDFIAPIVWYTYNAAPKSSTYGSIWRTHYISSAAGSSLGAGRAYSTRFLKKIEYDIFPTRKDIHLDTKMENLAAKGGVRTVNPNRNDGPIVSIKGSWDKLNDIEELIDNCPTVNFANVEFETSRDVSIVRNIRSSFTGIPADIQVINA